MLFKLPVLLYHEYFNLIHNEIIDDYIVYYTNLLCI